MMIEELSGKMWYLDIIKLRNARLCNNDKSTFHWPRHSGFTIMQGLAKWGRVRHIMAGNRINTTA